MPINHLKSDIPVDVGGKTLHLRPTFEAMVEFESESGVMCVELLRRIEASAAKRESVPLSFRMVRAALLAGLHASGERVAGSEVEAIIFEAGLAEYYVPTINFITYGCVGRRNLEKQLGKVQEPASDQPA